MLVPLDQARALEDGEVLDEAGERHGVRLRERAHGLLARLQGVEHLPAGGIREGGEDVIETSGMLLNHLVQYAARLPCRQAP